jgi:hypothetical protein
VWDVILSVGRRIKFSTSGLDPVYCTVINALYDGGTNKTTVTVVCDGSTHLQYTEAPQQMFYSILDPINTPIPWLPYYGVNTGSADVITAIFTPAVYAPVAGMILTVKLSATNATTTPTFNPSNLGAATIVNDALAAIGVGDLPKYAQLLYDISGKWVLLNPNKTSQAAKWAAFPIGYTQPFIPAIMGSDITTWLAAHTGWAKLTNTQVADIEGRAMAVSSSTHAGVTQAGADDGSTIAHTHTGAVAAHNHAGSYDSGHNHAISDPTHFHSNAAGLSASASVTLVGTSGAGEAIAQPNTGAAATGITIATGAASLVIASEAPAVTVNSTGGSATNANLQRTQWFDWIIKTA